MKSNALCEAYYRERLASEPVVAWLYFHNRAEPQLTVMLEKPDELDMKKVFDSDEIWCKPLIAKPKDE